MKQKKKERKNTLKNCWEWGFIKVVWDRIQCFTEFTVQWFTGQQPSLLINTVAFWIDEAVILVTSITNFRADNILLVESRKLGHIKII